MKKSIILFAFSMLFVIAVKAQASPAPKPAATPATKSQPVSTTSGGERAPATTPATSPAKSPSQTPATPPSKKGGAASKRKIKAVQSAPAPAKNASTQKIDPK